MIPRHLSLDVSHLDILCSLRLSNLWSIKSIASIVPHETFDELTTYRNGICLFVASTFPSSFPIFFPLALFMMQCVHILALSVLILTLFCLFCSFCSLQSIGYRDDPSIKNSDNPNSNQITFIQTVLFVENHRWANIPFICKCGKALDSRNTEVRIQFKNDGLCLFPDANFNEIVMRLQPNEAIWCKVNTKTPGFARFDKAQTFELDLTYKNRFGPLKLPAAYTRLILDSLEGDQSLFVRGDELREAGLITLHSNALTILFYQKRKSEPMHLKIFREFPVGLWKHIQSNVSMTHRDQQRHQTV